MAISSDQTQLPVLDSVAQYEKLHRVGEGTYGVAYAARDRATGEVVALKKVRFDRSRDGIPLTSLREIRVLQECRHPNIVALKKVVTGSKADSLFLVFEYMEHDMGRLLDTMPRPFSLEEIKCLFIQLLKAVAYMHHRWVIHRDIKMSNLLYSSSTGQLKLCDFGLSRYFEPEAVAMTPRVVTLWYRAPEILLGAEVYDEKVDSWALGCVLGELLKHAPLFPATSELNCLKMQCELLGTPTVASWKSVAELPHASLFKLPHYPHSQLRNTLGPAAGGSVLALSLLQSLLAWDPKHRLTAQQALQHPFFNEDPRPLSITAMPSFPHLKDNVRAGALAPHKDSSRSHHHYQQKPQLQHHHHPSQSLPGVSGNILGQGLKRSREAGGEGVSSGVDRRFTKLIADQDSRFGAVFGGDAGQRSSRVVLRR